MKNAVIENFKERLQNEYLNANELAALHGARLKIEE